MAEHKYEYGVLLPHFGSQATRERVVEASKRLEDYGFDSVWVRDHLVFEPHVYEEQDNTFVDPIVVLSAIAAVTSRITLATGSLIPHRNPIHLALLAGSLEFIAGPGRLLIGWGLGTYEHEFEAAGMAGWDRREVLPEQIEIHRRLWTGEKVTYDGKFYQFEDVAIAPVPQGEVPVWYCGTSLAAVRRAVEYCDGWIPGRMPRFVFEKRMARMQRLADEANRPLPRTGVIPWVVPGDSVAEAEAILDSDQLLEAARKKGYINEEEVATGTLADLDGSIIAGPPDHIVEETRKFQQSGVDHMVFDLRPVFDRWEEHVEMLGTEVLPALHEGDGRSSE